METLQCSSDKKKERKTCWSAHSFACVTHLNHLIIMPQSLRCMWIECGCEYIHTLAQSKWRNVLVRWRFCAAVITVFLNWWVMTQSRLQSHFGSLFFFFNWENVGLFFAGHTIQFYHLNNLFTKASIFTVVDKSWALWILVCNIIIIQNGSLDFTSLEPLSQMMSVKLWQCWVY